MLGKKEDIDVEVITGEDALDADEFLQGQRDCRDGIEHKDGTPSYNRGYSAQYWIEQILSASYPSRFK